MQVVKVDVERSLWAYTVGWSDEQRDEKRAALRRLLTAVVTRSDGSVHYYQVGRLRNLFPMSSGHV